MPPAKASSTTSRTPSSASPKPATSPTTGSRRRCSCRPGWASRCCSRARPASARPSSPPASPRSPAAGCCGCSATRARTRPRPSTSGTTASRCSTRRSCARRSARSSRTPPTSTRRSSGSRKQDSVFFSERFLAPRPLLEAIDSEEPVVLLIDEVDRADEALEAVLLELLGGVPDLDPRDRHGARPSTLPYVVLTSNNTRDLSAALKRRCLHLFLDYPDGRARAGDHPLQGHRAQPRPSPSGWSRSSAACASSSCARRRASPRPSTGPARSPCSGSAS